MAKIQYGALVTEIKGKIGGTVFQSGRYGFTVRNKPISPKTSSSDQSAIRNILTSVSKTWGTMTPAERTAWDAIAPSWPHTDRFGNPVVLTGFNLFVMVSMNLNIISQPVVIAASVPSLVHTLTSASVVASVGLGTIIVTFAPTPVGLDSTMVVFAQPPVPPGQKLIKSKLRFIGSFVVTTASPIDLTVLYVKKFGVFPPLGTNLNMSITSYSNSNGTASPPFNFSSLVSA